MSATPPVNPDLDFTHLSGIEFNDRSAAVRNLRRIAQRVPPGVAEALQTLLPASADPDAALNLFDRLIEHSTKDLIKGLERHRFLIHYAMVVFSSSRYLGETVIKNPELLLSLQKDRSLEKSYSREDYAERYARFTAREINSDISASLARFKRFEYVRIMLRDILAIAPLAETTAEISTLSDVLLAEGLSAARVILARRYTAPGNYCGENDDLRVPFSILSMGKLGGNELNYNSDVDLFFIYGDGDAAEAAEISNHEYFIRLAQLTVEILSRSTAEGAVFRIDLRLRPQGREGEPAVSLAHALNYYDHTARDWELQALIKARYSAGSIELARSFIKGVEPRVYSSTLNFSAIKTALQSQARMADRGKHRSDYRGAVQAPDRIDVKLQRGGIRDIEFLVQCLQRVYGGTEPWLRSGGTLFSLQKLHDKGHVSGKDFHVLNVAYNFLRTTEHRLQLRDGQQTHLLPVAKWDLRVLSRLVSSDESQEYSQESFLDLVRDRMAAVAEIYQRIIHYQQEQESQIESGDGEFALQAFTEEIGEQSWKRILHRLSEKAPDLYTLALCTGLDQRVQRNMQRFLVAAFSSSEKFAALVAAPRGLEMAQKLFWLSDHLTDALVRNPEELESIALASKEEGAHDSRTARLFGATITQSPADPVIDFLTSSVATYSDKLAELRRHYRRSEFIRSSRDVLEARRVFPSLLRSTAAADLAIEAAVRIADAPPEFAIIALGRLGTSEFDVASDADLMFVRESSLDSAAATRATEKVLEILSAYTREGMLFAVDARLRPGGGEGELVCTAEYAQQYFESRAESWEALSYTKMRHIAGNRELGKRVIESMWRSTGRFGSEPGFASAVREMRSRLEGLEGGEQNLKTGAGAFYDIDFLVSYLLLMATGRPSLASEIERGATENTVQRLGWLASAGLLSAGDYSALRREAELLRTVEHFIRLVTGRAKQWLSENDRGYQQVSDLTSRVLGLEIPEGLNAQLKKSFGTVREIFDRLVPAGGA